MKQCDWEARLAPIFAQQLRAKRRVQRKSWYVDETYISESKASGAIYIGPLTETEPRVDSMLSEKRDMEAAQAFFTSSDRSS